MILGPEDFKEMREHRQARSLKEEKMGPDCWLGARSRIKHPPSSSDEYSSKQIDHLRFAARRLGLHHVPGAEPAGILGARALGELGLGTFNPMLVLAILQNTLFAH